MFCGVSEKSTDESNEAAAQNQSGSFRIEDVAIIYEIEIDELETNQ